MEWSKDFPMALQLASLLIIGAGVYAGARGVSLFIRGFLHPGNMCGSLWVVRGIRGFVVGVGAMALAGGILTGRKWLIYFGLIFLAEEIYETGLLLLILRMSRKYY